MKRDTLVRKKFPKKSHNAKKTVKGAFGIFQHSVANYQKNAGGPFGGNFFRKKSVAVPKGRSLWSRPVWYVTRKNRKNLFGSLR